MSNVPGPEGYDDPFEEEWDDAEMQTQAADYQRMLDDADLDSHDQLAAMGTMDEGQVSYLQSLSYNPPYEPPVTGEETVTEEEKPKPEEESNAEGA